MTSFFMHGTIRAMNRQLFFFDMDGTLIGTLSRKVLPSTIEAVHDLQKQGHLCFLCTGRSYQMAMEYSDVVHPDGVVFCNGAGIMIGDELLYTHALDDGYLKEMMRACTKHHGMYQIMNEKYSWQTPLEGTLIQLIYPKKGKNISEEQQKRRASMISIGKYNGEPVLKMDVSFFRRKDADAFYAQMPDVQAFRTRGRYLHQAEIMASGISKAKGVQSVMEYYGIDVENTWCFGDSINDMEMMKLCGHAIAMGNAGKAVKECADYVCDDCNHDGIAKALEYFGWRRV